MSVFGHVDSEGLDDDFYKTGFYEKNADLQKYKELLDIQYGKNPPENIMKLVSESWDSITSKYPDFPAKLKAYNNTKQWKSRAEIVKKNGFQTGFFFQTSIVRELNSKFKYYDWDKATARIYINYIKSNLLTYPFLIDEAEGFYVKTFENTGFELPEGEATDLFRKIIEPYKGKIIMVDFWAVWCGPCLYGIEQMKQEREKYKDSEEIAILYICGDSPNDRYEQEVQKHGLYNSVLLSDSEYNLMRQLFKFNGIPRYALIDKDGKVLTNDFQYRSVYNFNTRTSTIDLKKDFEKYIAKN